MLEMVVRADKVAILAVLEAMVGMEEVAHRVMEAQAEMEATVELVEDMGVMVEIVSE